MSKATSAEHLAKRLFWVILIVGLALPSLAGIIVRTHLVTKGISVVSWLDGFEFILSATIFVFAPPFIGLALFANFRLARAIESGTFQKWWHTIIGAFSGTTLTSIYLMFGSFENPEMRGLVIAAWPWSLFVTLIYESAGGLLGGSLGWVAWKVRAKATDTS